MKSSLDFYVKSEIQSELLTLYKKYIEWSDCDNDQDKDALFLYIKELEELLEDYQ